MISVKYVTLEDKEFWFSLDAHLAESEFAKLFEKQEDSLHKRTKLIYYTYLKNT